MANFMTGNLMAGTQQAVSSTAKTIIGLTAATASLTQGCLTDVTFSQDGAPSTTDGPVVYRIRQQTANIGTSTAATPSPTQPGWRAAGVVAGINHTVEPTTPGIIYYSVSINQRASYRWMPVPGSEIYWPATNLAGLMMTATSPVASSYAGTIVMEVTHTE